MNPSNIYDIRRNTLGIDISNGSAPETAPGIRNGDDDSGGDVDATAIAEGANPDGYATEGESEDAPLTDPPASESVETTEYVTMPEGEGEVIDQAAPPSEPGDTVVGDDVDNTQTNTDADNEASSSAPSESGESNENQ